MTPRDIILTLGSAVIIGSIGYLVVASGGQRPVLAAARSEAEPAVEEPSPPALRAVAEGPVIERGGEESKASRSVETAEWTSGRVDGDIGIDPRVIDDITSITVEIRESRAGDETPPYRKVKAIEWVRGMGTPSFVFKDIPFSDAGYSVAVFGPGINGSHRFLPINEGNPFHEVELSLSPAVPFTVILRDQFSVPVTDTRVEAWPDGAPLGRPVLSGSTDNFGTVTFPKVLAGHYTVYVGSKNLPLVDPVEYDVMTAGFVLNRSAQVNHQGLDIEVPQGELVTVRVLSYGQPVAGARLRVYRTDDRVFREYAGDTDEMGKCQMPPLPEGRYHVAVDHPRYRRFAEEFALKAGTNNREIVVNLMQN